MCNQSFKKDKFPIKRAKLKGPVVRKNTTDGFIAQKSGKIAPNPLDETEITSFLQLHRQEQALLLNPYFDEPEEFFAWQADDAAEEVRLVPMPGVTEAADYCRAAEKFYGLNRPQLLRLRYATYTTFQLFRRLADEPGISQESRDAVLAEIDKMKQRDHAFAGMVRYFDSHGFG